MHPFNTLRTTAVPLHEEHVDTDQIIPAKYLTTVSRQGLGEGLFHAWRYKEDGTPDPDFVMNNPVYRDAEVLIAGINFGSGSSREHAVWALMDYGFRAVIAPSFADIFYSNSLKNGLLPVKVTTDQVEELFEWTTREPLVPLTVDLVSQTVTAPSGKQFEFPITPFRKDCLLRGLDDLGYLLEHSPQIDAFEEERRLMAAAL